jgi:DNA-binding LacI/PurR family transcriptional regulator
LEAASRLGYQPNLLARGLRTNRSGAIGAMVEDITDPFLVSVIPAVDATLRERGYHLLLSHAALDPETGSTYDRLLGSHVDGLLVLGDRALTRDDEAEMLRHHRHVVGIARACEGTEIPSFNVDDRHGVELAVDHLRGLGHEHIGFIGNRDAWDMSWRLDTFLDLMAGAGLAVPDGAVELMPHTAANGYAATRRLLASGVVLTALLCTTDLLAMGALCALEEAGLKVPHDISVIGWDDIPLAAYATPPLTTVRQPTAQLARRAVTHLLDLIDGSRAAAYEETARAEVVHCKLPPELAVRRTTGPRPPQTAIAATSGVMSARHGDASRSPPGHPARAANDHH